MRHPLPCRLFLGMDGWIVVDPVRTRQGHLLSTVPPPAHPIGSDRCADGIQVADREDNREGRHPFQDYHREIRSRLHLLPQGQDEDRDLGRGGLDPSDDPRDAEAFRAHAPSSPQDILCDCADASQLMFSTMRICRKMVYYCRHWDLDV